MKKFWIVYGTKNDGKFEQYLTYEEAELAAKHKAHNNRDCDYYILASVAVARQPVPIIAWLCVAAYLGLLFALFFAAGDLPVDER